MPMLARKRPCYLWRKLAPFLENVINKLQKYITVQQDTTVLRNTGKELPVALGIFLVEAPDTACLLAVMVIFKSRRRIQHVSILWLTPWQ